MPIQAAPRWNTADAPAADASARRDRDLEVRGLDGGLNAGKALEVAVKEFVGLLPAGDGKIPVLMSILQSKYESMARTAENMALTREEREALEERRGRIEKLRRLAEDKKLDEDEAVRALELILSDEDKKLLERQLSERMAFA